MAVTKIWPVKGRLDAVMRYAGNEEKTRLPDLTGLSAGKDDLSNVLQYAANDAKTSKESQLFVSGVNCVAEIARQQMELTKQQFGKTGGTVAFHAYQSFRPGEVTPEQCHAIGVELAKCILERWLSLEFKDSPSTPKVVAIKKIESENRIKCG